MYSIHQLQKPRRCNSREGGAQFQPLGGCAWKLVPETRVCCGGGRGDLGSESILPQKILKPRGSEMVFLTNEMFPWRDRKLSGSRRKEKALNALYSLRRHTNLSKIETALLPLFWHIILKFGVCVLRYGLCCTLGTYMIIQLKLVVVVVDVVDCSIMCRFRRFYFVPL